jgi:hypothetical protein
MRASRRGLREPNPLCCTSGPAEKLWIELGEKERLLSDQEVLKEMENLHALHVQLLGTQSSAPHARHATGAAGRDAAKARVIGPSCDLTGPERQSAPPRPAHV